MESKPSYSCGDHLESSLTVNLLSNYLNENFVETGTNTGAGVRVAIKAGFKSIISMDIEPIYIARAKRNFRSTKNRTVKFFCGDSATMLSEIISNIHTPVTFWLDGHEMKNVPLLDELKAIAAHPVKNHTIIIDDVRMFDSREWGIENNTVKDYLKLINPEYKLDYFDSINGVNDILIAHI